MNINIMSPGNKSTAAFILVSYFGTFKPRKIKICRNFNFFQDTLYILGDEEKTQKRSCKQRRKRNIVVK